MAPLRKIEIGAQFAIGALQHVEIESGGHAGAVVVSRFQNLSRFLQVDPDDEPAAVSAEPADALEKILRDCGSMLPIVEPGK